MGYQIAIDGPAGAGKSVIAKRLAKELSMIYIDTGAMYRAIAYYFIKNELDYKDLYTVKSNIVNVEIEINLIDEEMHIILNKNDVSSHIRTPIISEAASIISIYPCVRDKLINIQRNIASNNDVVMDGRDITSNVLKDANLKIFLTASVEERARRRYKELLQKNKKYDLKEIEENIRRRDKRDINREINPLVKVDEAVLIDSSNMTIDEVVSSIKELYKNENKGS